METEGRLPPKQIKTHLLLSKLKFMVILQNTRNKEKGNKINILKRLPNIPTINIKIFQEPPFK